MYTNLICVYLRNTTVVNQTLGITIEYLTKPYLKQFTQNFV